MSEVKYSKEHEWIKIEGDVGTIGITQHATEMLGDIVFVELPEVGISVEKDGNEIIHKGISQRSFSRSFTTADDVKVNGAELKDGLLTISCEKIVPEQKKKKLISIK